ncbi:MAG TPA: PepSY-like domain-containing protein [Cytophagaceae bacterium]|nr:PepSY-like domain-containing protein [Cytophagaceae bacterium]
MRKQDVPEDIRDKFKTLYPSAGNVQWNKEIKNYKVFFIDSGRNISVSFDKKGNVRKTEIKIEEKEVPDAVMKTINKEYHQAKLISFSRIDSRHTIQYAAIMDIKKEDYIVFFTPEGKIIRQMLNTKE